MATAYTSLLGLALPVTGELSGTWGDTVNNAITSLLDSAVAGTTTLSTDADVTLTTTTGATNQARQAILLCSGARTAIRNITAPAQSKMYVVINNTTGGYGVVIRGAGPTTGVTVANGKTAVVVWNGSDFVEVAPAVATNLSGGTAGALPYQTAANTTAFLSIGTSNFVLTSNGTAPVWTTNTGTGNVVRATSPTIDAPTITTSLSASAPIFTTGTISSNAASRLGLQANEIWSWGANASTQGTVTFRLRSSDGSLGSSPVAITSAGMDVTGALTASTSARSPIIIGGTGTTSTLALRSTSGVGTTGADIIFQTGNNGATEAMRILNSGNVGIGTTSPSVRLHATATGASATEIARIQNTTTTGGAAALLSIGDTWGGVYHPVYIGADYFSYGMRFQTNRDAAGFGFVFRNAADTVSVLSIDTSTNAVTIPGQVLLGSGSASNPSLSVSGDTNTGIHFPAADTIAFVEGGAESMRLNSSGNLGLGTSSPLTRLDVRGNVFVGRTDNGNNIIGFGWTSMSGAPDSSPGNAFIVGNSSNAAGGPSNISFWTCTGGTVNERMRIESNGNVGIGTSSPGSRLTVAGTVAITANGGVVSFTTSTAAVDIYGMYVTSTVGTTLNTQSGTAITFNTGVTERMRIDSAGNVGIGTTSPVNKLDISGSFGRGAPVTKTTSFTLAATENWVICNGAGTITVALPAASSWTGREVMIKTIAAQTVVSASSNVVPLTGGAAGTAILAATAGKWATLVSDGTNWVIMSAA